MVANSQKSLSDFSFFVPFLIAFWYSSRMQLLYALLLGIVQGVTEFLPVSSTAHLVLAERLLGASPQIFGLSFDASLHLGTLGAILIYFRADLSKILKNTQGFKLLLLLVVGTVPAVVVGVFLQNLIESLFRTPLVIATMLIFFSFVFWVVEKNSHKNNTLDKLSYKQGFLVGCLQVLALIPGVSRSGIVISGGLLLGLVEADAARFAFLLSIPIVALAGGKSFLSVVAKGFIGGFNSSELMIFGVGMVTSALVGFATIDFFLRFLKKGSLTPFIIYRIALGILILFFV